MEPQTTDRSSALWVSEDGGQRTEDRCARFAHARQKLLDIEKVIEDMEKSPVTQESFFREWNFHSSMFCLLSPGTVLANVTLEWKRRII
ncbi:hypothetical protein BES34_021385 [Leptospira inadai serovar Lyme]|uniref:Uncharacterized protein n=1 Tax=Leptospira inadai serovar Lyme TaxID=293084 RepID=A0ABX4YCJ5_9LEPT|nr:hypothetical protein BES34_021385 [Leptospira inadai serovar Lyme]